MIRPADQGDVDELVQLIHDLADFERSPASVEIEPGQLQAALFGDSPAAYAHVAEEGGRILGMAIWFRNFSTWTGRSGIYLEDLYVRPEARARGIGRALIAELATIAHRAGYGRVDWSVLDWNESAIRFYRSLGAVPMDEWTGYRLAGPALAALGTPDHREE
jgi:GNAT superfamily N-acetyltransferase